jgi:inorganic pyrophosphatase
MDPIIDVLIETTQGSKHKYEYDHERRAMRLDQLPEHLLAELENFFDVYKMLEPGTSPAPDGYEGREAALREVEAARNRAG